MDKSAVTIIVIALIISVLGVLSIYSATYQKEGELWQSIYKRQLFWVILGISVFFLMLHVNYRRLWDWVYILYGLALVLLILVFILGIVRLGAQRWLKIAWLNFQPTEIVKLIMAIFLARYFSVKSLEHVVPQAHSRGIVSALILPFIFVLIPVGFIVVQPDLGSAVLILAIFIAMLYHGNVKLRYVGIFLLALALSAPLVWHSLRAYQKDRLLVFLNPNIDPLGAGYTIMQSKIAVGSGGFFGKGWLSGTQSQLHFLPESHTDFIFSTFSEEWGFLGGALLLFLYYLLIMQGFSVAKRTYDSFGRLLAFGISSMLALQIFINIAMNLGFAPVVGLPLPLMSYGGSSLLATFISLGILANISKSRT